jgi:hypothetical protein
MANVPTPEFQKLRSNLVESLRLVKENTIQHPDADAVREYISGILAATTCVAGCTPESVGGSPRWTLNVQNMKDTKEKSPPASERKADVWRPVWSIHRSYTT